MIAFDFEEKKHNPTFSCDFSPRSFHFPAIKRQEIAGYFRSNLERPKCSRFTSHKANDAQNYNGYIESRAIETEQVGMN